MSVPKPTSDFRPLVKQLIKTGEWEHAGFDSRSHGLLRHDSGETITFSCHGTGDRNAVRQFQRDAERVMGTSVFSNGHRRKSKGKQQPVSDFDLNRASKTNDRWHAVNDGRVEALWDKRARMIQSVDELAAAKSRESALKAAPIITAIREVEHELMCCAQPVEPFAPNQLGATG